MLITFIIAGVTLGWLATYSYSGALGMVFLTLGIGLTLLVPLRWFVMIFVALLPVIAEVRLPFGGGHLRVTDVLIGLMLLRVVLGAGRDVVRPVSPRLSIFGGAVVASYVFSSIVTHDVRIGIIDYARWTLEGVGLAYAVGRCNMSFKDVVRSVELGLAAMIVISLWKANGSALGIIDFRNAVGSFAGGPNILGGYSASAIPLILGSREIRRVEKVVGVGVALIGLLASYSRGSIGAAILGLLVIAIMDPRFRYLKIFLPISVGGVLIADHGIVGRLIRTFHGLSISDHLHVQAWRTGIKMFLVHPLAGIGPGNFQQEFLRFDPLFPEPWAPLTHAHDFLVTIGAEIGTIGVITWAWLIYEVCRKMFNRARAEPAFVGVFGTLVALLCDNIFDFTYQDPKMMFLFWFLVGLVTTRSEVARPSMHASGLVAKSGL